MSSDTRELHAVLMKAAALHLCHSVVLVETDNSTTMGYINHLGGRFRFLALVTHELWQVYSKAAITLRTVHRSGVDIRRANVPSR